MHLLPRSFKQYLKNINTLFVSPDDAIQKFTTFKPPYKSILYALYLALIPSLQTLFGVLLNDPLTRADASATMINTYLIVLYPICLWLGMGFVVFFLSLIFKKRGNFFQYLSGTAFMMLGITFMQFFIYLTHYELNALVVKQDSLIDTSPLLMGFYLFFYLCLVLFIFTIMTVYSFTNYVFAKTASYAYGFSLGQQVIILGIAAFFPIYLAQGNLPLSLATYIGGILMYGTSIYTKNPIEKALFPALYKK